MGILNRLTKLAPQGKFFRDILALAGGTTIGQLLVIAASPLLTRLYTPTDFGLLAIFSSSLGILSVAVSLRYEFAIPIAKSNEEAKSLLVLSLLLVLFSSVVVGVAVVFWGGSFADWVNAPRLESLLWLLPVGLFFYGALQAINYWYTRVKGFSRLGVAKTLQSAGQILFQLLGGFASAGSLGLVGGQVVGRFVSTIYLLPTLRTNLRAISLEKVRHVIVRYKKFPLYTAAASLVNVLGTQAPAIMFAKLFSSEIAGLFSLTVRILSLPAALIGQAIGQALYPRLAEKDAEVNGASGLIGEVAMILLIIAFPTFTFIGAYGPPLFSLVFGSEWKAAGLYAAYLSPWLLIAFISSPLSMFVFVKEKQGTAFALTLYETILRIGSIWIGKFTGAPECAVALYSFAGIIISVVYIGWIFYLSKLSLLQWAALRQNYFFTAVAVLFLVALLARSGGAFSAGISLLLLTAHFWYALRRYGRMLYA